MVIQITSENIDLFEKLIPTDIATKIYDSRYFFIGALETEEDDYEQAVGVLVFSLERGKCIPVDMDEFSAYEREENAQSDMTVARIEWVYVDEEYRRKGHFAELIEVFYECMDKADVDPIVCDIPDGEEYEGLVKALEEWQFVFCEDEIFRLETTIDEIMASQLTHKLIDSYKAYKGGKKIVSLSNAKSNAFEETLSLVDECVEQGLILDREFCDNPKMYDMDLSMVMYNGAMSDIEAALLVRQHPSGSIQPIFLNAKKGTSQKDIFALLNEFIVAAKKKLKDDTPIIVNCLNDSTAELIDRFLPQATALQVLRGISSTEFLQDM